MSGMVSALISVVALAVSIVAFLEGRSRDLRAARLARRPALVFAWDDAAGSWRLANVGAGPALDVVILQWSDGTWVHPLRMPEMGVDDSVAVPQQWYTAWHHDPALGARYRSITDEQYSTITRLDRSTIADGWGELGNTTAVEPHWQYR